MTLTKADIVESVQETGGFTNSRSVHMVEFILESIKSSLESGEDVLLSGFGKFSVRAKKKRKGRNPATRETMMLQARNIVTFRSSPVLRKIINGTNR